jgi:hypothetical protein
MVIPPSKAKRFTVMSAGIVWACITAVDISHLSGRTENDPKEAQSVEPPLNNRAKLAEREKRT